ncbi:PREDICTED: von Willebrand factor A domain-containing protein 3B [Nanorana parkeri]|uniref:von Willebrand factor A domain-containing protein 3B n=1 Tax=Nanorana parkeri TaxID=125878 RepID=UPI0008545A41|nr:PREDICTED: von Willebrand factor A domain-containing protein 3B [Nanorana parkeri]
MSAKKMASNMDVTTQVSSTLWLKSLSLKKKKLTLPKILAQLGFQQREDYVNKLGRPVSSRYSNGLFRQYNSNGKIYNLTTRMEEVVQKAESLKEAIGLYNQRLDWLKSSSRLVFGVIQEQSITIILDLSTVSKVQYDLCRDAISLVIREQVAQISKFNLIWVSQEPVKWHQNVIHVTQYSIQQAVEWIWNLQHSPVVTVESAAEALSEALDDQVDAVYYFCVGDVPVGKTQRLLTCIENSPCPLHVVSYHPHKMESMMMVRELSLRTSGRFHVWLEEMLTQDDKNPEGAKKTTDKNFPEFDLKKDEELIAEELEEAQETLKQLQDILRNLYHSEEDTNSCPVSEEAAEDCVSSEEWLKMFGLKPQKLLFYEALADCAFRHSDGVVDIRTKPEDESVQTDAENNVKLINAKYCDQFVHILWKDGSVVHVHISKEKYRWYEERMKTALNKLERRVKWLQKGSRELFGTILEDQVYILIDTSHSMKDKLFLVKEKIFQLMQEQLKHKKMFNFVKFDAKVEAWKAKLAEVNKENMKEASYWVKELQVGSSTNTLKALQVALSDSNTQAVYLLTDGRPDQPTETFLEHINLFRPVPIHTISFNCDDTEANSFLYELSNKTSGRFHAYTSQLTNPDAPQPFVSEDIKLLLNEIDEGRSNLEKVKKLHVECLMLDWYHNGAKDLSHRPLETQSLSSQEFKTFSPLLQITRSLNQPRLIRRKKIRHAEHTKSSILRALSHGVTLSESTADLDMPPETRELFLIKDKKTNSVLKDLNIIERNSLQEKPKRKPKTGLDISSSRWLKTHGLVARRLTIMDALAPTTIPHSSTYIPVLDKHVVSKVFDEVFPLAHVSGNRKLITLINPQAVNLADYKEKLEQAIKSYERRLNLIVWRALSQIARDKFDSDVPVSYLENKEALLQALDRLGWPVSAEDVMLLEDEIVTGKTYLQQATDLQEASKNNSKEQSSKEEHEKQKTEKKVKRQRLDALRGQKVIARSEVDGFYYSGTVLRSINSKRALVDFVQGENLIVPIRFILQTGGAIPWPILKVGDCVFAKTGAKGGGGCYLPAVVIATPRSEAADKLYTVLYYNNRKGHCLRSEQFKISPSQFSVSCSYIRKAQMIDYTIPSVQFVEPILKPSPPKEEKKSRSLSTGSRRSLNLHVRPRTPDGNDSDSSTSADSTSKDNNLPSENTNKKLEDLALQISQHQKEQKENQQQIQRLLKELTKLSSHQGKNKMKEEEEKDLTEQKIDLLEQLKMLIPISNTKKEVDVKPDVSAIQPAVPGQKVVSVCSHNGWYEEGFIIHDCGDLTYFVKRASGEVARIQREDILSDADDYTKEIKEGDCVIGPHPLLPGSYCPGIIVRCTPDLKVMILYQDNSEAIAPREQVYLIGPDKYERATAYILQCKERWVGQPVIARNDDTGAFHLAEVLKHADDGKQYVISWSDGKTTTQDIEWIFGKFSQPHILSVGDHVLTLANPSTFTFLPGVIIGVNGAKLQINFCDGRRCNNVESYHCFGLSEKKYNSAFQFYQQCKQRQDADKHYISSDTEDSLSDISSFTVSSVGSNRKAVR